MMYERGNVPHMRLSSETARLSPIMKYCPDGTVTGPKGADTAAWVRYGSFRTWQPTLGAEQIRM